MHNTERFALDSRVVDYPLFAFRFETLCLAICTFWHVFKNSRVLHTRTVKSVELIVIVSVFTLFDLFRKFVRNFAVLWIFILGEILRILLTNRLFWINYVAAFLIEVAFVSHTFILLIDSVYVIRVEVEVNRLYLFCKFWWTLILISISEPFHVHVKLVSSSQSGLRKLH